VRSVVDTAFHLSDGRMIEPGDFIEQLQDVSRMEQVRRIPLTCEDDHAARALDVMLIQSVSFWDAVHLPYLAHELTRADARQVVERGLQRTRGSYKQLVKLFNMKDTDYLKFMDFLRHQRLKPD